jgi:hypothetical protein
MVDPQDSAPRHLQGTIKPNFERSAFLQLQPSVAKNRLHDASSSPDAGADDRASAASYGGTPDGADPGAHSGRFTFPMPVASLPFNFAFFAGRLQAMLSRDASYSRNQRHPSMFGLDFVEA